MQSRIHEVNANSFISNDLPEDIQMQLDKIILCIQMIKCKNGTGKVDGKFNSVKNEVTIILFNGCYGIDTNDVDAPNKKVINLIKALDANVKIDKEPYKFGLWSQSLITFSYSKIEKIIEALGLLDETPKLARMEVKC